VPEEEIDRLRSVLAHAHEKRQPLLPRLIQAIKDCVGSRSPISVIESLNIEKDKDAA
jgi:hypothetical protein